MRSDTVDLAEITRFTKKRVSYMSDPKLFLGARMLTRPDGVLLLKIEAAPNFPKDDDGKYRDLDELALAVSMAAKEKLNHTHDVHANPLGAKRDWWRIVPSVSIEDALVSPPVRLVAADVEPLFAVDDFDDKQLWEMRADQRDRATRMKDGEAERPALICLRRSYLKVFETLQSMLRRHRDDQREYDGGVGYKVIVSLATVLILGALYAAFLGWPMTWWERFNGLEIVLSLAILLPAAWALFHQWFQLVMWDLVRIRLLRSAQTFYHYANPLNGVIQRVVQKATVRGATPATDFTSLLGILDTKTAGETHRASVRQFVMSLALGVVAIYFAALAIRDSAERAAAKPPPGVEHVVLRCGEQQRLAVGPFPSGEWERVEQGGLDPIGALARLREAQPELHALFLIGSTDDVGVRALSHLESNSELARRRAVWVADQLRQRPHDGATTLSIYTIGESLPLARAAFDVSTSGREVILCRS